MKRMINRVVFLSLVICSASTLRAQVSVNLNFGPPPPWGPAGYTEVRYYYLPDIETYYDIQTGMFIYFGGGRWISAPALPPAYSHYDLYGGRKIVIRDYYGPRPYTYFETHRAHFPKGYRGEVIEYRHGPPGHREREEHHESHGEGHGEHGHGHGHGRK